MLIFFSHIKEGLKIELKNIKSKLNNHTETVVLEIMDDLIKKEEFKNICTCNQCLLDIASYALNRLPARYIVTQEGEILAKLAEFERQLQVDAVSTITKAIRTITKKPNH